MDTTTFLIENIENTDSVYTSMRDTLFHYVCHTNVGTEMSFVDRILGNAITVIIALIAGLVALYQVKSNVVSTARIKWIEDLRESISELYEAALSSSLYYEQHTMHEANPGSEKYYDRYVVSHSKFFILSNKIKMQINIEEQEHSDLYNSITEVSELLGKLSTKKIDQHMVQKHLDAIVKTSQIIFKKEWNRSKKLFKI